MNVDKWKGLFLIPLFLLLFVMNGFSQDVRGVYVYPERNQTKQQQQKDQNACYSWAEDQASANPSAQEKHGRHKAVKGGGIGGAAGAVLGGGKGAVIGGAAGALGGHHKQKKQERQAGEQTVQDFNRAYASCLKGRGYSVQ